MKKESIKAYSYRISQASRTDLVVIMYDMAMEYIKDAILAEHQDDQKQFHENLKYAKRVLNQLSTDLDMQYEVSNHLFQLYRCIDRLIIRAESEHDGTVLQQVIGMIEKLRNSFYEISKTDTSGPMMRNTQQVYSGLTYSNLGQSNEISTDPVKNRGYIV